MEVSSGDLVATAGYSKRMGQLMPDNVVKVRWLVLQSTSMLKGQTAPLAFKVVIIMSSEDGAHCSQHRLEFALLLPLPVPAPNVF